MKTCFKCKTEKAHNQFSINKIRVDGLQTWCKLCQNTKQRETHIKNPERIKEAKLRYLYKISLSDYNNLLTLQNGLCAICKEHPSDRSLDVDHNHKTKKVRGLLCRYCNLAVGNLRESKELAQSLISYLDKFSTNEGEPLADLR